MQAKAGVTSRALKEILNNKGYIEIPSHGVSMLPLIRTGNICRFEPVHPIELQRGDIILFQADTGILVGHRYLERKWMNDQWMVICKGDSNLHPDAPVPEESIIGKMVSIRKPSGTMITSSPRLKLWGRLVIRLPLISLSVHSFLRVSRKLKGMKNSLWAS
ncbi:signal peptidase I [Paenibacillus filicis]|uniref:Signal peptidase I n=1 Tax=Paenibacillus gyeongsangnamensis TaxID=3388067 RepID=A0ABT4QI18_9BACL|nr:signal peptidase I [Paenibacillus filicis]MCZ8516485.1 signal peptidase I [Paenibacillus filicis]